MTAYLPRSIREKGRKTLLMMQVFNTVTFAFSFGEVILLLALFYGASDTQMAFMFAGIHLCALASITSPYFFKNRDNSAVWFMFWFIRSLICLSYLLLPFIEDAEIRIFMLIGIYYLFMLFKSIGGSAWLPAVRVLSTERERPEFISNIFNVIHILLIFSTLVSYLFLEIRVFGSELSNFHALIIIGVISGLLASYQLNKLPPTGMVDDASMSETLSVFKQMLKNSTQVKIMHIFMLQTAAMILLAYSISFFRNIMELKSEKIILLTLFGLISATLCTKFISISAGRINAWSILLIGNISMGIGAVIFAFSPEVDAKYFYFFIPLMIFIFAGRSAAMTIFSQMQADSMTEGKSLQNTIIYQLCTAVAGLSVLLFITCLEYYPDIRLMGSNNYSVIFLTSAVLCIAVCFTSYRVHYKHKLAINIALISPQNIYMMYRLQRLRVEEDSGRKNHIMEGFLREGSQISKQLMDDYLKTSDVRKRYAALRCIVDNPNMDFYPQILVEALSSESPIQIEAITALGFLDTTQDKGPLLTLYKEGDNYQKAIVIKTLLRLGHKFEVDEVLDVYKAIVTNRMRLHIIIGAIEVKRHDIIEAILRYELDKKPDAIWTRAIFHYTLEVYDRRLAMVEIFDEESALPGHGIEILIDYMDNSLPFPDEQISKLQALFIQKNIDEINALFRQEKLPEWMIAYSVESALGLLFLHCQNKEQSENKS